jgi:hypothetical protein
MKLKLALPRFRRDRTRFARTFTRYACQIDTHLTLIDRMSQFEGRIIDISNGGALFRPKLAYLMHRANVPICIHLGSEELFGQIVNTSPKGFSIRFEMPLDDDIFEELTASYKLEAQNGS